MRSHRRYWHSVFVDLSGRFDTTSRSWQEILSSKIDISSGGSVNITRLIERKIKIDPATTCISRHINENIFKLTHSSHSSNSVRGKTVTVYTHILATLNLFYFK